MNLSNDDRNTLTAYLRAKLMAVVPDPDNDCLPEEDLCLEAHPIHAVGWVDGELRSVYARLDPLLELIVEGLSEFLVAGGSEASPRTAKCRPATIEIKP